MKVEIVLDIPCVWSYFGFTRFERAVTAFRREGGEVDVTFRPFQLFPDASVEGEPKITAMRRSFGADTDRAVKGITAYAAGEGLEFRHEGAVMSNTFEAHRLIAVAAKQDLAEEMVERLFRAHHTDELNVADVAVLKKLASEVGVRWDDDGAEQLRAELKTVRESDVRAIPVFRFEGQQALSGNQSYEVLAAALGAAALGAAAMDKAARRGQSSTNP